MIRRGLLSVAFMLWFSYHVLAAPSSSSEGLAAGYEHAAGSILNNPSPSGTKTRMKRYDDGLWYPGK